MSRLMLAPLIFIIALTAFAPPGLCPCWLYAHVEDYHPHSPFQAAHPHSHTYLHEIYQTHLAADVPATLIPAALFVLLLAALLQWRRVAHPDSAGAGWNLPTDAPPPRLRLLNAA
jgi:hypothetical protein